MTFHDVLPPPSKMRRRLLFTLLLTAAGLLVLCLDATFIPSYGPVETWQSWRTPILHPGHMLDPDTGLLAYTASAVKRQSHSRYH